MNNGNGLRKIAAIVAAVVGTVVVSIAGAFFAFGQQQQSSIVRLEASEAEDARQKQVDQATIRSLLDAIEAAQLRLRTNEQAIAVLEAKVEALEEQAAAARNTLSP